MDLREATPEDVDGVRRVAGESLAESYGHALDEELLATAVERWYDADQLADQLADGGTVFTVAVDDGEVIGFAQGYVVERREPVGEIDWIHVLPEHRGRGIGSRLLGRTESELRDRGVGRIEGRVLATNEAGTRFYESAGYDEAGDRPVEVGDTEFRERIYVKPVEPGGEQVVTGARTTEDGKRVYVAYDESVRASEAPFYETYLDRDRTERYGWFCGNCESFDTAMDSMERIECNDCGNRRKATRWDAAYL